MDRTCDGCGQTDDHPRFQYADGPETRLFHYDCVPHFLRDLVPEPALKATAAGKRGDDVRDVMLKHAEKIAKES